MPVGLRLCTRTYQHMKIIGKTYIYEIECERVNCLRFRGSTHSQMNIPVGGNHTLEGGYSLSCPGAHWM